MASLWSLVCRADGADLVVPKGQSAVVPKVSSAVIRADRRVELLAGTCLSRFILPPVEPIPLLIYDG
jgi:hypothetical protein